MKRYFLATNDVESTSIKYNKQRNITAEKVLKEGMPILLDIYKTFGIKATFFFTGEIAEKYPDIVRMILPEGHEVACHGYSHEDNDAFDKLGFHAQVEQLSRAKNILEEIAGVKVSSFRSPALRVNEFTPQALIKSGFTIDSSIASQRADSIFSFGTLKKLRWIKAPRKPYFTSAVNLAQRGNSSIFEIPISALLVPYIGTAMRISPGLVNHIRQMLDKEAGLTGKPINFLIHPNEFIIESDIDEIANRSKNPITHLFAEKIGHALKMRNLGEPAKELYRKQLTFFKEHDYSFLTLSQYKEEIYP
jgi:peptidoglycan/xylan/chitin deacetylase (PgdA/CDA1 family)